MEKTREEATEAIKQQVSCTDYLEESKKAGQNMYCCPWCGSGDGENHTGALRYYKDTNAVHCFSCGHHDDVIGLYRKINHVDFNTALKDLADKCGITITGGNYHNAADVAPGSVSKPLHDESYQQTEKTAQKRRQAPQDGKAADYTEYCTDCKALIHDPAAVAYLESRGIDPDTAEFYGIGFDPAADPAGNPGGKGKSVHPCPRIIIPTTKSHYMGRSIDPKTDPRYKKMNSKGSHPGLFNSEILSVPEAQEIFVTEGAFDALSVLQAGAHAIALNSTSNTDLLLKALESTPAARAKTFILCLDTDTPGKKAAAQLREGLQRLNVSFIGADICGGCKDPNEALQQDQEKFIAAVDEAKRQAGDRPDNVAAYINGFMGDDIEKFKEVVGTGFNNLDSEAGGLYSGLYTIAAISSLGKTTFCAQMADQIAAAGHDVIFFSLEQSRFEMVSKSLARITAQDDQKHAVTSLQIRRGQGGAAAKRAAKKYIERVGKRVSIIEGNFNCNLSFIRDYIRQYIRRTNTRPVVFVDYLQILQPELVDNRQQSTRETVDATVTGLKRLSRELDLTIFIVSSVNRANYLTPIDFEALKESGGIEYTSDVIWGLQLQCLREPLFDKEKAIKEKREKVRQAKAANPRKIELVCLKNRYGKATFSCYFEYFPANDLFIEDDLPEYAADPTGQVPTDEWLVNLVNSGKGL